MKAHPARGYALVGLYRVAGVARVAEFPRARWHENAHLRRAKAKPTDVVVHADPARSGRLRRCIPIGEFRDGAYRVRRDLLVAWGGLSCRDGFIQRSAVPPRFRPRPVFVLVRGDRSGTRGGERLRA